MLNVLVILSPIISLLIVLIIVYLFYKEHKKFNQVHYVIAISYFGILTLIFFGLSFLISWACYLF